MARNLKEDERKFILECIDLYRDLPCLWKTNSGEYTNRAKKEVAYNILLSKYQERYSSATKEDVKRKFNSLRTNFRKEVKKMQQSELISRASGSEEVYETTMWYYDAMLFLKEHEMAEPSRIASNTNETFSQDSSNELVGLNV